MVGSDRSTSWSTKFREYRAERLSKSKSFEEFSGKSKENDSDPELGKGTSSITSVLSKGILHKDIVPSWRPSALVFSVIAVLLCIVQVLPQKVADDVWGSGLPWWLLGLGLLPTSSIPWLPPTVRFAMGMATCGLSIGGLVMLFNLALSKVMEVAQPRYFVFMPIVGSLFSALLIKISPTARTDVLTVGRWLRDEKMTELDAEDDDLQFVAQSLSVAYRAIASIVALGCGVSLGPTAPRAEIGANFALLTKSLFLRQGSLPPDAGQALWASGMAAGVAAGAKAPFTGGLFALEVCYLHRVGQQAPSRFTLSGVLLAAALAAIVSGGGLSIEPSLQMVASVQSQQSLQIVSSDGWVLVILGLVAGFLGLCFKNLQRLVDNGFRTVEDRFRIPSWLHPVIAGCLISLVAFCGAQDIMFLGWQNFQTVLNEPESFSTFKLVALIALKLVLSSVCQKSGLVGGLFAPALYSGAVLGVIIARFVHHDSAGTANMSVVGMAACLSTIVGTPVTAVALVFELTQVYSLLSPVIVAVACSQFFVSILQPASTTPQAPEVTAGSWGSRERWKRVRQKLRSTLRLAGRKSGDSTPSTPQIHEAIQRGPLPPLVEYQDGEIDELLPKEPNSPDSLPSSN